MSIVSLLFFSFLYFLFVVDFSLIRRSLAAQRRTNATIVIIQDGTEFPYYDIIDRPFMYATAASLWPSPGMPEILEEVAKAPIEEAGEENPHKNNLASTSSLKLPDFLNVSLDSPFIGFELLNYCDYSVVCEENWQNSLENPEEFSLGQEEKNSFENPIFPVKMREIKERKYLKCQGKVHRLSRNFPGWLDFEEFPIVAASFLWKCPGEENKEKQEDLFRIVVECRQVEIFSPVDSSDEFSSVGPPLFVLPSAVHFFCSPPLFALNRVHSMLLYSPLQQHSLAHHWRERKLALDELVAERDRLAAEKAAEELARKGRWFKGIRCYLREFGYRPSSREFSLWLALIILGLIQFFSFTRVYSLSRQLEGRRPA